jgi:hypothetical protein
VQVSHLAWLKRRISSFEVFLANLSAILLLIEFFLSKNQGILPTGSGSSARRNGTSNAFAVAILFTVLDNGLSFYNCNRL